jgi:hypothetical protein
LRVQISAEELNKLNVESNILSVIQADFQVDSTMAGSILSKDVELVLLAESDLATLLGSRCLAIERFGLLDRNWNEVLKELELFRLDVNPADEIVNILSLKDNQIIMAKKHIFDRTIHMRVQCLISAGIGCDVFIEGAPGITPKVLMEIKVKMIKEEEPDLHHYFYFNYYKQYAEEQPWESMT